MLKFTATSIHLTAKCRRGGDIATACLKRELYFRENKPPYKSPFSNQFHCLVAVVDVYAFKQFGPPLFFAL